MDLKLNYVRLLTENFSEMHNFYSNIVGLKSRFSAPEGPYDEFITGGAMLALFDRKEMFSALSQQIPDVTDQISGNIVIIFQVDNVDASFQEIKSKGYSFLTEPMDRADWFVRTAHLRDPDGNIIELNQPLSMTDRP